MEQIQMNVRRKRIAVAPWGDQFELKLIALRNTAEREALGWNKADGEANIETYKYLVEVNHINMMLHARTRGLLIGCTSAILFGVWSFSS
jgi:hypothetical protein